MSRVERDVVVILLAILCVGLGAGAVQASRPPSPPREQYPGHVNGDDLRDGVTLVYVTVPGYGKVPCIYSQFSYSYKGGMGISCDWRPR